MGGEQLWQLQARSRTLFRSQSNIHAGCFRCAPCFFQEVTVDNGWDSAGYTTYRVYISFDATKNAKNCYSIFGETGHSMIVPPARQVATPFGNSVGGVSPAFWAIPGHEECKYDSWLTVGVEDGNPNNAISSIGITFDTWSTTTGLKIDDGAVFWMNPDNAPDGRQVVAQLTIPEAAQPPDRRFTFSAQGRTSSAAGAGGSKGNWKTYDLTVQLGGEVEPVVDCEGRWGDWGGCDVCGPGGRKTHTYRVTQPASGGGKACQYNKGQRETIACKPDERPCPPAVVSHHVMRCSNTTAEVTTTLKPGGVGGTAIFDFVLDTAQAVTISNQLPKDCPTLRLFSGTNTSGVPLIQDHGLACGHYDPVKATLAAGRYTVVAETVLRRTSRVKLTALCREPTEGPLNPPLNPPTPQKPAAHANMGKDNADIKGNHKSMLPALSGCLVAVAVLVGLCYLCVMKRANGSLNDVSKRRRDLDAHLDTGLDADFDEPRFSTQHVHSISGTRHSFAE